MAEETKKTDNNAKVDSKANADKKNPVQEILDEKGKQSAENISKGGNNVKVSLTNKTKVEFTKDYGKHIKKGHVQEVSDLAFEIYDKAGVIKKL